MNTWFKDIDRAQTRDELVSHARDYLALLHPRELDALPQEYRELRLDGEADIPRLREKLSDGYARVRDAEAETDKIRDLVEYFSRASRRLGELGNSH
ncbi:MAG TPA: hypothetical protein VFE23_19185 [Usitatibacter sp.]|jgi:septation ring formation regulator EzrA|nr:hypothetical protein [Usitatibacter sp.]